MDSLLSDLGIRCVFLVHKRLAGDEQGVRKLGMIVGAYPAPTTLTSTIALTLG